MVHHEVMRGRGRGCKDVVQTIFRQSDDLRTRVRQRRGTFPREVRAAVALNIEPAAELHKILVSPHKPAYPRHYQFLRPSHLEQKGSMGRTCLLVAVFLAFAKLADAQQPVTGTPFGPSKTVITFTLQGELLSSRTDPTGLPLALLARLARERTLAKLEAGSEKPYEVKFAFGSMAEFNAWYTSPETEELLKTFEDASGYRMSSSVAVVRPTVAAVADG